MKSVKVFPYAKIHSRKEVFSMHENIISRKVFTMNELVNKKNVQHNDLITSVTKMEMIPLKFFELAVSCIDPKNPPKSHIVYLSKQDLFAFFDASDSNKHSRFKQAIEKMQKQAHFVIEESADKGFKFKNIVPIPYVDWNEYNDEVTIEFNHRIMPYLIGLKKDFTQYEINEIMKLDSKYSIVLYKWLTMNYNQYEHYQFKGDRSNNQLKTLKNPVISVKNLRKITDTETTYSRMYNFTKRVLDEPITEINKNTSLNIDYKKIKRGGRVSEIQFLITKKEAAKNEFYKEEEQDPAYLEDKKNKKQDTETLYIEALGSNYTDVLGDYKLIDFKDIRDKELMAGLQKSVYPLYDDLLKLKGMNGVEKHISYVSSKMEDYTHKNIVRYLNEAIRNYLPRANIESDPSKLFGDL